MPRGAETSTASSWWSRRVGREAALAAAGATSGARLRQAVRAEACAAAAVAATGDADARFSISAGVCVAVRVAAVAAAGGDVPSGRDGEAGAAGQLDRAAARAAPRAGAGVLAVTATRSVDVDDAIDLAFAADLYDRKFCLSEKQSKNT